MKMGMKGVWAVPVIVGIAVMMTLSVLPAMAAQQGTIKDLFPPGNNGQIQGVGIIDGDDGNHYVFKTPEDNNGASLTEGQLVTFDVTNGRHATNVICTSPCDSGK